MANLIAAPIEMPGTLGLDTQNSQGVLSPEWATVAEDLVLNKKGRLSSRPGCEMLGTPRSTGLGHGGGDEGFVYSNPTDGAVYSMLDLLNNKVSEYSPGGSTWTTYTTPAATQIEAVFSRFNDKTLILRCAVASFGGAKIQYQNAPGTNYTDVVATTGTVPAYAVHMLCAWGRVWTVGSNNILQWSDILDETAWGAGTANQIDLHDVWPNGEDEPEALAEFNGFLIVLGKQSIVVYEKPDEVAAGNMVKVEAFSNVGCVNFQTIQQVGDDLVFLAKQGLVSFSRLVQEKSMPVRTLSDRVRDDILEVYETGYGSVTTKSAYSPAMNLYVLMVGSTTGKVWFFDTSRLLEDGTWKVTAVDKDKDNADGVKSPWKLAATLFNDYDGRSICLIGYPEQAQVGGTGAYVNTTLRMRSGVVLDWIGNDDAVTYPGVDIPSPTYTTGWLDLNQFELSERLKISKKLRLTLENCNSLTVTVQWFYDYDESTSMTESKTAADKNVQTLNFNLTGSGTKVKLKVTLNTSATAGESTITRMTYYAKIGKQIV